MPVNKSTEDYRKYPKGPNFLYIVLAFCATILIILGIAFLFLSDYGKHLLKRVNTQSYLQVPYAAPSSLSPKQG